jgi:hypothetical protein
MRSDESKLSYGSGESRIYAYQLDKQGPLFVRYSVTRCSY